LLEPRTKIQDPRSKIQEPRTKIQEPRTKIQDPRTKNQERGTRNTERGTQNTEPFKLFKPKNMYTLIDGKAISEKVKEEIAEEVKLLVASGKRAPHLAVVIVGHDGGSETYVAHKVKSCHQVGFKSTKIAFEADVTEAELLAKIDELNRDESLDGFIVQLPLPKHISEQKVIEAIDYRKDVDGFHPVNVGRLLIGLPCYVCATPSGIMELIKRYEIPTAGKSCVVIGSGNRLLH